MDNKSDLESLDYAKSGVNIDVGSEMVKRIKNIVSETHRPGVMSELGGFGALFDLGVLRCHDPILVATTDGVGTKVKLAALANRHFDIGIDLVAMCVNDLIVQGAQPLFFLDYFASSQLQPLLAEKLISGIAKGCQYAGCALVGGETAEMPGVYQAGEYDLAGFCVGVVERQALLKGDLAQAGDSLIGIASNGLHANGFSLVRAVLERTGTPLDMPWEQKSLQDELLRPTRIYVKPVLSLLKEYPVTAIAHITGGGILENLPRAFPTNLKALIDPESWERPAIFDWIKTYGGIAEEEMWRVFNCGVGMVIAIPPTYLSQTLQYLGEQGETVWQIGELAPRSSKQSEQVTIL